MRLRAACSCSLMWQCQYCDIVTRVDYMRAVERCFSFNHIRFSSMFVYIAIMRLLAIQEWFHRVVLLKQLSMLILFLNFLFIFIFILIISQTNVVQHWMLGRFNLKLRLSVIMILSICKWVNALSNFAIKSCITSLLKPCSGLTSLKKTSFQTIRKQIAPNSRQIAQNSH